MPDRQTFDGHLTSFAAKTGEPHVIHLESTLIKMVDEAVKCAMEGTEDIERFVVTPQPQPQISPSHPTIGELESGTSSVICSFEENSLACVLRERYITSTTSGVYMFLSALPRDATRSW